MAQVCTRLDGIPLALELVRQQHANYFLSFADALDLDEARGSRILMRSSLLDQLEREHDNLRAALRWWIESQDADRAVRQAATLFPIWFLRGSFTEGRAWLEEVLALPTARDAPELKIHALPMLANLARRQGEYKLALSAFNALLAEMESAGDTRGAAQAVSDLANVHYLSADFTAGWTCLERSRAIAGDLGDPMLESGWRFLGGQLALHEGRNELARSLLAEELEMAGPQSGTLYSGYVLMNLGSVCREQGDYVEADRLLTQGLQLAERYGDNSLLPLSVAGMSALATALGQHERALCLAGAAAALEHLFGQVVQHVAMAPTEGRHEVVDIRRCAGLARGTVRLTSVVTAVSGRSAPIDARSSAAASGRGKTQLGRTYLGELAANSQAGQWQRRVGPARQDDGYRRGPMLQQERE